MRSEKLAANLNTVDDPWAALQDEALSLRGKEPLLAAYVTRLFPDGGTFGQTLALRLADLLEAPGIGSGVLSGLFLDVMAEAPKIEANATCDLRAVRERDPACATYLHPLLNFKGYQALQAHRFAHVLLTGGRTELASWLSGRVAQVLGLDIHPAAKMGCGIMLDHGTGIVIGETAVVEDDVSILQNVTLGGTGKTCGDRHPKVRRGVMIGAGAKILGNVEIGAYSKVAAGSVVLKDVPAGCTVAGIPAVVVRVHGAQEMPSMSMDQSI